MQLSMLPKENKVEKSIKRVQMYEPEEGYYLAYSGGKDSDCAMEILKMSGVKFDAHYNLTTVDPPELVQYIKEKHPEVQIHYPKISMWRLIEKKLMPPTRIVRYCCDVLKEGGGQGRFVITGVRWAESASRATRGVVELNLNKDRNKVIKLNNDNDESRKMVEACVMKSKHVINPIIDWTDEDVWDFIKERNMNYCKLYDEGFERLGCVGCPLSGRDQMLLEFERWPKIRQAYKRAFDRMIIERRRKNKNCQWNDGEQVMDWWIYGQDSKYKPISGQVNFDEYDSYCRVCEEDELEPLEYQEWCKL